jgi:hypothetical protein
MKQEQSEGSDPALTDIFPLSVEMIAAKARPAQEMLSLVKVG